MYMDIISFAYSVYIGYVALHYMYLDRSTFEETKPSLNAEEKQTQWRKIDSNYMSWICYEVMK